MKISEQEFNDQYKVGQRVIYTDDFGKEHITKTTSMAWDLCGTPVVKIEGKTGGYDLECMVIVEVGPEDVTNEEGENCPQDQCDGVLEYGDVEGCSCHISPPCSACVDNPLVCVVCGWEDEE